MYVPITQFQGMKIQFVCLNQIDLLLNMVSDRMAIMFFAWLCEFDASSYGKV